MVKWKTMTEYRDEIKEREKHVTARGQVVNIGGDLWLIETDKNGGQKAVCLEK